MKNLFRGNKTSPFLKTPEKDFQVLTPVNVLRSVHVQIAALLHKPENEGAFSSPVFALNGALGYSMSGRYHLNISSEKCFRQIENARLYSSFGPIPLRVSL